MYSRVTLRLILSIFEVDFIITIIIFIIIIIIVNVIVIMIPTCHYLGITQMYLLCTVYFRLILALSESSELIYDVNILNSLFDVTHPEEPSCNLTNSLFLLIKVNYWLLEQTKLKLLSFYWLYHLQATSVKQWLVNSKLTVVSHNSF